MKSINEGTIDEQNSHKKFSLLEYDMFRYRSHSCQIPDINSLAYCLDFVPKLK